MTLHRFEGRDVIGVQAKVTKTGDGLSQAVALDPDEHSIDDEVYLLVKGTVTHVGFRKVKDTGMQVRIETIEASTVTLVPKEFAHDRLEAQRIAIEAAKGIERLTNADGSARDDLSFTDGAGEDGEPGDDGSE